MARDKTRHVCQECGYETARWLGRCPDCGAWNSLVAEERGERAAGERAGGPVAVELRPIREVSTAGQARRTTGIGEFDRVLGGGVVPGSLVLIGGDPGIGKSTLLLQAAARLARQGTTIYVTGEESAEQIRRRGERLNALAEGLFLAAETRLDALDACLAQRSPAFLVIDSIQTMHDPDLPSAPGTVTQVRACGARLLRLAKADNVTVFLIGHVTKSGAIAGPRLLEHMVDTVLYFEGDRFQTYRILRAVKNRYGPTDEIGLFEMRGDGLAEIPNASQMLLSQRPEQSPGSAVLCAMEGARPLLVEAQALVARSYLASPRRTTTGVDANRAAMLLAVLEKRCGLRMSDKDVYLNITGGLRVIEPAADLGLVLALASSYRDAPLPADMVAIGEVGLAGEVRAVRQLGQRLREAARLGFRRALVPAGSRAAGEQQDAGLEVGAVSALSEALASALPGE